MKHMHKNYLTKLLGYSEDTERHRFEFENEETQTKFKEFKFKKQITRSKSFSIYLSLPLVIIAIYSIYTNKKPIRPTYFLFIGVLTDFLLSFILKRYETNYDRLKVFRNFRFFLGYSNACINWVFPVNPIEANIFRYAYCIVFYINFFQNYFLELNYFFLILLTILNSIILFMAQFTRNLSPYYLLPEIIINVIYYYIFNLFKKSETLNEKDSFYESLKNNNYIEYIQNLVNVLNTMIISIKNEDVLFINDYALNYFMDKGKHFLPKFDNGDDIENVKDSEILMDRTKTNPNINSIINNFFNQLLLNKTSEENFKVGEYFNEIIKQLCHNDTTHSQNFIKVGYFTSQFNKDLCFEIHVRKLKYQSEALEILIYDISEIKQAEMQAVETKYKHKILTKIAHEFKTPLITIISLINKILKDCEHFNIHEQTKKSLYYIYNLSNYTLSLISDIIQYVSEYMNLRINKNEINIYEVMDFSNNVLRTLIECNEIKCEKIKTKLIIDNNLENIKIYTDENRLKQIILNLISNAFKFTQFGIIKLKAKYLSYFNIVEISVKDSGIGIKEEDHHLIFKENIQLNLNNEYNSQGSGLGLSIVKNLADALNYKIGFISRYGKGSKFFIRIECFNKMSMLLNRTINYSYNYEMLEKIHMENEFTTREPKSNFKRSTKNVIRCLDLEEKRVEKKNVYNKTDLMETNKLDYYPSKVKEQITINYFCYEITSFHLFLGSIKEINNKAIKLLMVDDHKLVREFTLNILKTLLKEFNSSSYEIVECCDGIELLNKVRLDSENQIKLILIDENMEYLNGSESVNIIRKLEENKKLKYHHIVSITAFDDQQTKERIMKSGVNSIMTKPCNKSDLAKILNNYFIPFIVK